MAEGGFPEMLNVLLLGRTGRGKSTTGNKLIDRDEHHTCQQMDDTVSREWPEEPAAVNWESEPTREPICFAAKKQAASVTKECSVIANTQTGFRVMDTRGFAPSDFTGSVYQANLQIVREVVRVATVRDLHFHRVLYFLPERHIPERADGYLQEELSVLWHFYGENIFKNMIIVVTAPAPKSESALTNYVPDIDTKFGEGSTDDVRSIFQEALKQAIYSRENAPPPSCPDIVYIPFQATSESVAEIVRNVSVHEKSGISLKFQNTTCSKCASVIHIRVRKGNAFIDAAEVEGKIILPEQSQCHPAIIPKYTKFVKFMGGVAHIITLGIPQAIYSLADEPGTVWPWFTNSEEKCAKCEAAPSVKGCTKIGDSFSGTVVQHSHDLLRVQVEDQ